VLKKFETGITWMMFLKKNVSDKSYRIWKNLFTDPISLTFLRP